MVQKSTRRQLLISAGSLAGIAYLTDGDDTASVVVSQDSIPNSGIKQIEFDINGATGSGFSQLGFVSGGSTVDNIKGIGFN